MISRARLRSQLAAAAAALAVALGAAATPAASLDEYAVKAAFLLNFARLVEWPPARQPAAGRPFVVAVAGSDAVERAIAAGLAGKSVGDNPVIVRHIDAADEVVGTHIVYVAGDAPPGLFDAARRASVLSVGESERFAAQGGVVSFFTEDQKLRFRINPEAAGDAGLKVSSRLLGLAVIVKN